MESERDAKKDANTVAKVSSLPSDFFEPPMKQVSGLTYLVDTELLRGQLYSGPAMRVIKRPMPSPYQIVQFKSRKDVQRFSMGTAEYFSCPITPCSTAPTGFCDALSVGRYYNLNPREAPILCVDSATARERETAFQCMEDDSTDGYILRVYSVNLFNESDYEKDLESVLRDRHHKLRACYNTLLAQDHHYTRVKCNTFRLGFEVEALCMTMYFDSSFTLMVDREPELVLCPCRVDETLTFQDVEAFFAGHRDALDSKVADSLDILERCLDALNPKESSEPLDAESFRLGMKVRNGRVTCNPPVIEEIGSKIYAMNRQLCNAVSKFVLRMFGLGLVSTVTRHAQLTAEEVQAARKFFEACNAIYPVDASTTDFRNPDEVLSLWKKFPWLSYVNSWRAPLNLPHKDKEYRVVGVGEARPHEAQLLGASNPRRKYTHALGQFLFLYAVKNTVTAEAKEALREHLEHVAEMLTRQAVELDWNVVEVAKTVKKRPDVTLFFGGRLVEWNADMYQIRCASCDSKAIPIARINVHPSVQRNARPGQPVQIVIHKGTYYLLSNLLDSPACWGHETWSGFPLARWQLINLCARLNASGCNFDEAQFLARFSASDEATTCP